MTMQKNRMDHAGAPGSLIMADGYAMNSRPGPEMMLTLTDMKYHAKLYE